MSQKSVEQIIGKMLLNLEYRKLMASDQEQALAGYDLTEDERAGLKTLDIDDFHKSVTGLDERISKGRSLQ